MAGDGDARNQWMVSAMGVDPKVFNGQPSKPNAPSPSSGAPTNGATSTQNPPVTAGRAAPPLKIPALGGSNESQRLRSGLAVLDGLKPLGDGMYEVTVDGKPLRVAEADVNAAIAKTRDALQLNLRYIRTRAESAIEGYKAQSDVDRDSPIVSRAVKLFGGIDDPGDQIMELAGDALKQVESSRKQLDQNHFVIAGGLLAMAEYNAKMAAQLYTNYHENIISTSETTVKVLEYTEAAAAVTLAVTATIVTAGAAAGATSIAGVDLGAASTANAIAMTAPMAAKVAQAGVKVAYGEKVDWAQLAVEAVVTAVLAKFAPQLSEGIAARLVGSNPAAAALGRKAVAAIVAGVATGRGSAAVQAAANAACRKAQGQNVTWETLVHQIGGAVLDPKGAALDLILSGIGAAGAARGTGGPPPRETPAASVQAKAAPAPDPPPAAETHIESPLQPAAPTTPNPAPHQPETAGTAQEPIRGVVQGGGAGDGVPRGKLRAVGEDGRLAEPKAAPPAEPAEPAARQAQQQSEEQVQLEQEQPFKMAAGDHESAGQSRMIKTGPATQASREAGRPSPPGQGHVESGSRTVGQAQGTAPSSETANRPETGSRAKVNAKAGEEDGMSDSERQKLRHIDREPARPTAAPAAPAGTATSPTPAAKPSAPKQPVEDPSKPPAADTPVAGPKRAPRAGEVTVDNMGKVTNLTFALR